MSDFIKVDKIINSDLFIEGTIKVYSFSYRQAQTIPLMKAALFMLDKTLLCGGLIIRDKQNPQKIFKEIVNTGNWNRATTGCIHFENHLCILIFRILNESGLMNISENKASASDYAINLFLDKKYSAIYAGMIHRYLHILNSKSDCDNLPESSVFMFTNYFFHFLCKADKQITMDEMLNSFNTANPLFEMMKRNEQNTWECVTRVTVLIFTYFYCELSYLTGITDFPPGRPDEKIKLNRKNQNKIKWFI